MHMPLVLTNRRRRGGSASAPAFSPSTLYSSGSQGVWYDPSDLTTMFVDRAGTTPVTTPGQLVGLRLDKSKGLVLGAELVTNGDFATDTDWTKGTSTVISGGSATATAQTGLILEQAGYSFAVGKTYEIRLDVSAYSAGGINIRAGNNTLNNLTGVAANGSYVFRFAVLNIATQTFSLFSSGTSTLTIDNISVRELPGNHATAPTDAARPMYGVEPKGGRRNLLTWSEDASNAIWVKERSSVAATTGGYLVTVTGASFSLISQVVAGTSGVPVTFTVIAKAGSVGCIRIGAQNGTAGFDLVNGTATAGGSISAAGDGFYKCIVSYTGAVGQINYIYLTDVAANVPPPAIGSSLTIKSAQLELGSTATPYQRVTIAEDVTEAGVPTCHYCRYDGANNSMSTSAIDFTATDKMSVFAGVRKLSDAAAAILLELSTNTGSVLGSFYMSAPNTAGVSEQYGVISHGNATLAVGQGSYQASSTAPAPDAAVLSGLHDIAADSSILRRNGVANAAGIANQGTGNFGNHSLFIGRRGNASLPFNGRDFGIIIVGKAASAGEITDTETWLAAKTAQVTL